MAFTRTSDASSVSRRTLLHTMGLAGVAAGIPSAQPFAHAETDTTRSPSATTPSNPAYFMNIELSVNGERHAAAIDPRTSLLDFLRDHLHLTGTKKGCDHGQCGACTVHVNGRRVNACLTLAATHHGDEITTIEGIGQPGHLHPMQAAFVEHDGYQCGYCTSGQIMSAVALLKEPCGPNDAEVRELMSGNICRCGAYKNILAAIQQVRQGI